MDALTDEAVILEHFYVTVFDIDQQRVDTRHRERLCMNDDEYDEYVLRESTSLLEERQDTACDGSEGSSVVFASTAAGFICDNPTDPLRAASGPKARSTTTNRFCRQALGRVYCEDCDQCVDQGFDEYFPIDQADRSVMFVFRAPRSHFDLSYTLPCVDCFLDETTGFNGGRNFLFGGSSSLCVWPTPVEPPRLSCFPSIREAVTLGADAGDDGILGRLRRPEIRAPDRRRGDPHE